MYNYVRILMRSTGSLTRHDYVHCLLQKIRLHYVATGDESKPLMLFIHGFPEFWYSWRHQITAFASDYRFVSCKQWYVDRTEHVHHCVCVGSQVCKLYARTYRQNDVCTLLFCPIHFSLLMTVTELCV